jgi:hypothetical protein
MTSGSPDKQGLDSSHEKEVSQGPDSVSAETSPAETSPAEATAPDAKATEEASDEPATDHSDAEDDADDEGQGLRWNIVEDAPGNPFTSNLLFSEDGQPLLWWSLDPVTLNELLTALTTVKRAQLAALTGTPQPEPDADAPLILDKPVRRGPVTDEEPDRSAWPWWRRHKIATFFLVVLVLMFLVPFITLGGRV